MQAAEDDGSQKSPSVPSLAAAVQQVAAEAVPYGVERVAFYSWQGWTALQIQQKHLQQIHLQHVLRSALQWWTGLAADARTRQQLAEQAFQQELWDQQAQQHLRHWRLQRCVASWRRTAGAGRRCNRLLSAWSGAMMRRQLQRCFSCWWQQAARQKLSTAAAQAGKLQVSTCSKCCPATECLTGVNRQIPR